MEGGLALAEVKVGELVVEIVLHLLSALVHCGNPLLVPVRVQLQIHHVADAKTLLPDIICRVEVAHLDIVAKEGNDNTRIVLQGFQ